MAVRRLRVCLHHREVFSVILLSAASEELMINETMSPETLSFERMLR